MNEGLKEIAACPHCGSSRVHPISVIGGPIIAANRGDNMIRCEECGRDGVLMKFESEEALQKFRLERQVAKPATEERRAGIETIPIIPLHSKTLLGGSFLESTPFRMTDVVSVEWDGKTIKTTGYEVSFAKYWSAVGSTRYRAERVYVLDILGIKHAEPSFSAMRELAKCDCGILLDLGAGTPGEIMDGFMVDVEKVIGSTKSLKGIQDFKEIYALTDNCIPCIDWDEGIVWSSGKKRERIEPIVHALIETGYDSIVLMDLARLGTWAGPNKDLVAMSPQLDIKTYIGGGIKEEDVPFLKEKGIESALIDPYTPIIKDIILHKDKEPKATAATAPQPSTTKDVHPSPV